MGWVDTVIGMRSLSNKAIDALALKIVAATSTEDLGDIARIGHRDSVNEQVRSAGIYLEKEDIQENLARKLVVLTTLYQLTKRCVEREKDDHSKGWNFQTFIVEEAGFVQDANIREGLAACEGTVRKLVLVGDQKQLQPIVKHEVLKVQGYGRSCLEVR